MPDAQTADIFHILKRDHEGHRALFRQIEEADDPAARAELFTQLAVEVSAHAAAEEESLYATMLADPELRDEARHSVAEHKEIDDHLGALEKLDPASAEWTERFATLRHRYLHHIDEEEEEMFPEAAEALPDEEEVRLAEVFAHNKPAELERAENGARGDERD